MSGKDALLVHVRIPQQTAAVLRAHTRAGIHFNALIRAVLKFSPHSQLTTFYAITSVLTTPTQTRTHSPHPCSALTTSALSMRVDDSGTHCWILPTETKNTLQRISFQCLSCSLPLVTSPSALSRRTRMSGLITLLLRSRRSRTTHSSTYLARIQKKLSGLCDRLVSTPHFCKSPSSGTVVCHLLLPNRTCPLAGPQSPSYLVVKLQRS